MHKIRTININPAIFKTYDIRGAYPEEINEDAAYRIARAFARYLALTNPQNKTLTIIISADARPSSSALKAAFIDGLRDEGTHIIDAGLTTTPMHYFIINHAGAHGGAMITASHIAGPYNGIKLSREKAMPIGSTFGLEEIQRDALRGVFRDAKNLGEVRQHDFQSAYADFYEQAFRSLYDYHTIVVADSGNGMVGTILPAIARRFPHLSIVYLDKTIDMTFPHHEANPIKMETMLDVQGEVTARRAALGISFDGDGDRIGFVDETGELIRPDAMIALFMHFLVQAGDAAVYDIRSTRAISETVLAQGGRTLESKVGHSFIKHLMRKENAVFGGEASGHYYFRDFFYADSALFAFFVLLKILQQTGKSLRKLVAILPHYAKSAEINFHVEYKEKALDRVATHFHGERASYLDGLKIEHWDDFPPDERWWLVLRPSNTENLLRLNVEAISEALRDKIVDTVSGILQQK